MMQSNANIPIYECWISSSLQRTDVCRLLEIVDEGNHDFMTDSEVLQEILPRFVLKGPKFVMRSLRSIIPIQASEINAAIGILDEYPQISTRDAVHAAVVRIHGLEGVVSADRHFDVIRGVTRFDPLYMFPD